MTAGLRNWRLAALVSHFSYKLEPLPRFRRNSRLAHDSLPAFRRNVVAALEERVREMEHRFRDASTEDVASRLSSELIRPAKRLGDDNCEKEILLSQRELAQLTSTSPFTVNRLLSQWHNVGIVRTRRKAVQVCDPSALALLAVGK